MYGRDITLLDTRRLVLQMAGFVVHVTDELEEVQAQLAADPAAYELLIVCHTAPAAHRRALADLSQKAAVPICQIETLITPEELIGHAGAARR